MEKSIGVVADDARVPSQKGKSREWDGGTGGAVKSNDALSPFDDIR